MIGKLNKSIQFGQATYAHSAGLFFLIIDLFVRPLVALFRTSGALGFIAYFNGQL